MIRVPVYMNDLITKWRKKKEALAQKLKTVPSDEEIAKRLRLSKDKVEQINFWLTSTTSSLDAPIGEDNEGQVSDLIEDTTVSSPDEKIGTLLDKERVGALLATMTSREKQVLTMRFGLHSTKPHTLAEVAKKLGVSRERIRQIEDKTLKKLKKLIQEQEKKSA